MWRPLSPKLTGLTRGLRFDAQELSGGLGDIGVMIPIVATLIIANGFNPTSVLLVFGATYLLSGLYFRIPMPVQPLKAMAAIAIAQGLSPEIVSAAGLVMAAIFLLLAFTNLIRPLSSLFTRHVVRGIQLGVGLLLIQSGYRLATSGPIVRGGEDFGIHLSGSYVPIALLATVTLLPLIFVASSRTRVPFMLLLLPPALLVGAFAAPSPLSSSMPGPVLHSPDLPAPATLLTAFLVLVLPQIPLTLGNAVIASTETARGYYGDRASKVSHRSVLISKGIANTAAGILGGMPVCHGAGGHTAHYRFGARTGGATVMLGGILIVLALGFGSGAAHFFALIPLPVLAALLCLVGIQHSLLARDVRGWPERAIVVAIAGIGFATGNLAWGFLAGIAADQLLRLARRAFPLPSREELPVAAAAVQSGS
ncbi:MAG: putative sulfate/molybdate transporter [Dehalococcoidia bacterium]